jgi:hypothetical protein
MNEPNHNLQFDDEHLLDMLVDGELSEDDRRDLLARLDRDPVGWRRCALAFLEGQDWRRSMRSVVQEPVAKPAAVASAKSWWWSKRSAGNLLAIAASFLLAFALGWGLNGGTGGIQPNANSLATVQPSMPKAVSPAVTSPHAVTLVLDDGGTGRLVPVEVPLVEQNSLDANWLNQPSALPLEVQQALERMGHQVRQQRQLLPVQLEGGRQGVVPIDQIEVVPVSNRGFQ